MAVNNISYPIYPLSTITEKFTSPKLYISFFFWFSLSVLGFDLNDFSLKDVRKVTYDRYQIYVLCIFNPFISKNVVFIPYTISVCNKINN